MISVMMCDDQEMVRNLIFTSLEKYTDLQLIGFAASGEDCIQLIKEGIIPNVLLLDVSMPNGMSGYHVAKILKKDFPQINIIALSMLTDNEAIKAMIHYGAKGFILKMVSVKEIVKIIHLVMSGQNYYPPDFNFTVKEIAQIKTTKFDWAEYISPRELEAIHLFAADNSIKQVAHKMGTSDSAVNKKMANIFAKTKTGTRTGALSFLKRVGLLP